MPVAATLLCAFLFLDLAYVNRGAVRHDDRIYTEAARVRSELDAILTQDNSVYRVGSFRSGWGANFEMYLGYQSVGGYTPLFLHRYREYIDHYRFCGRDVPEGWIVFFYEKHKNSILMDLLNVKYEISHETKSLGLRETYLPRAFLVPRFKFMDKEEILDTLIRPEFDPTQVVLFEKGSYDLRLLPRGNGSSTGIGKVKIISYRPDSIVLSVDATSRAFLFLSEVYYPGWKAFIDGNPERILRGDYLFRVIEVPKGRHKVHLEFDPLSIKAGVALSLFSVAMLLTFFLVPLLRRTLHPSVDEHPSRPHPL
jgi:hypothetical protein